MAHAFTKDAENCMRLVQLLRGPGCTALQNVLVQYSTRNYGKPSFEQVLLDPGVEALLKGLVGKGKPLTKGQWFMLYGRHFPQKIVRKLGKPETFDITLTFLLVRNLCGLAPPRSPPGTRPCWDSEPAPADISFEANLARIKFYRNYLCHHETGEIPDHEFNVIFDLMKQAIADISTTLNLPPPQWSVTPADLERFRTDPISQDDAKELENMRKDWKQSDKKVFDELESMKDDQKKQHKENMDQFKTLQAGQENIIKNLKEIKTQTAAETILHQETKAQEEIMNLQQELCSDHSTHLGHIQRLPTDEDDTMPLKDVYVKLSVNESVLKNTEIESRPLEHYSEVFLIAEKGSHILVEGEPGMGKTTFVKKVTTDWVDVIENTQENVVQELKEFDLVFVVPLGFVQEKESLASLLIDQHGLTIEKKNLERILLTHDRILLILDGYDEYTAGTCPQIDAIIQKKLFKKLSVLVTSRPYKSTPYSTTRRLFQHHFQIEGFRTIHEMKEYVQRFFQDERKADSFIPCLENYKLFELSQCPLTLLILCLIFEEEEEFLALELHTLYWKLMDWFYQRFLAKGGQCDMSLEEILIKVGKIALKGLLEGQLLFKRDEIEKELSSYVFKIGFLSSKKIRGSTAKNILVSFPHKSIQEYAAAYYLAHSPEGWDALNDIPMETRIEYETTLVLSVDISNKCLPVALGLFNPLSDKVFDFYSNYKRDLLDGFTKHNELPDEILVSYGLSTYLQCRLSSYFHSLPVVINSRNLHSSDAVPYSKVLSLNDLTARDIVDESQTILACHQYLYDIIPIIECEHLSFVILTNSMIITIHYFEKDLIENQIKSKLLKCIIGCGLDNLSSLRLTRCNLKEIREMFYKPKDLKILALEESENTKDLTSQICKVIARHPNLHVLDLWKNTLDWQYVFSALTKSGIKNLRTLMLYNCKIPADCEPLLVEFIRTQKYLVSINVAGNSNLANILPKMVETTPSIFNLECLGLGPDILPKSKNALKAVISGSLNLRELQLAQCFCDVSKEIIERKSLEVLNISYNHEWAINYVYTALGVSRGITVQALDVLNIVTNINRLQNLRKISAWNCFIGDFTMDCLIQNVHNNPNLTHIDVLNYSETGCNSISEEKANIYIDRAKAKGISIYIFHDLVHSMLDYGAKDPGF